MHLQHNFISVVRQNKSTMQNGNHENRVFYAAVLTRPLRLLFPPLKICEKLLTETLTNSLKSHV